MADPQPAWSPSSWTRYPSLQLPSYESQGDAPVHSPVILLVKIRRPDAAAAIVLRLRSLPPLVSPAETALLSSLISSLTHSADGFILQGGDCAEMFCDCTPQAIDAKVALLQELSGIVRPAAGHVITIGRIAGQVPLFIMLSKPEVSYIFHQYSKPRSSDTEVTSGGDVIQSYRYFAFAE